MTFDPIANQSASPSSLCALVRMLPYPCLPWSVLHHFDMHKSNLHGLSERQMMTGLKPEPVPSIANIIGIIPDQR